MLGVTDYAPCHCDVFLAIPVPGKLALVTSTSSGITGGLAATRCDPGRPGADVVCGGRLPCWPPEAFAAVQWLGAAYLAWLGIKMLLAKPGAAPVLNIKAGHYLRQALWITLLNPKAILFYMAFFPLFVDRAHQQGLITYGFMAATIAALTFLYGLGATLLTHFLAERVRANPMIGRVLEKVAGLFLVGFGVACPDQIESHHARFTSTPTPPPRVPMAKIFCVANQKGGVGKTTTLSISPPVWPKWGSVC
jgi:arginine exporter protein ArgO